MSAATYRRPGSEARHVRNLVFDRLPSVVRERLTGSLLHGSAPTPLLVDAYRRRPQSAGLWRIIAAAALVVEAVLWFKGFGDATNPLSIEPRAYAAAHAVAIFALLFAAVRAVRLARGHGGAPFPDGRYLFALDLVEVEGPRVRVTELHTLRRVEARPGKRGAAVVLIFADAHEVVFDAQGRAEVLAERVKSAVDAAVAMILPDDQPRMERLDPFFELRVSDDWASAEADASNRRSWLLRAPLPQLAPAILVVSALVGVGLFALRNRLSDDEMFVEAIEIADRTNDPHRWKIGAYAGVRHVDEIDAIRLDRARGDVEALNDYLARKGPRAVDAEAALFDLTKHDAKALAAAVRRGGAGSAQAEEALYEMQKGDLDALVEYIKKRGPRADQADDQLFAHARKSGEARSYRFYLKHGKRHADEVQSVLLPAAAYAEIEKSADAGDLGAFVREYPDSAHAAEIKAKIHAMYADALATFRTRTRSPAGVRFVTALLAELEDRGDPSINLDVSINPSAALTASDVKLAERYGAEYLPADLQLEASALTSSEQGLRADLNEWILSSFANGTVRPRGAGLGAETGRPSITVLCEPIAEGALASKREKLRVADVRFRVDFQAVVPGRAEELSWKYTTPGIKVVDQPENPTLVGRAKGDREAVARDAYWSMQIDGTRQVLDRIQLDL
ncbi:MAG: hypothetical protein ABJE95_15980 [Byssovorax sp.]